MNREALISISKRYLFTHNIPKIIHFYWGGEHMSWLRYLSLYSAVKFNPEFKIILHIDKLENKKLWKDEAQQDFYTYKNSKNYFDKVFKLNLEIKEVDANVFRDIKDSSVIHRSDIYRWKFLSEEGGLYFDTDMLFVKPISQLYESVKSCDLVTCFFDEYFSIGFLGSSAQNPFFKAMFAYSNFRYHNKSYESCGIPLLQELITGSFKSDKDIIKKFKTIYSDCKIYSLFKEVFYNFDKNSLFYSNTDYNLEKVIAIHWFAGYKDVQEFNNLLNSENYHEYNCIFTKIVDEYLKECI